MQYNRGRWHVSNWFSQMHGNSQPSNKQSAGAESILYHRSFVECLWCKPDKKQLEGNSKCYNKENGTSFVVQLSTQTFQITYPLTVVADIKKPKNPLNRRCPICENTASPFWWQLFRKASVSSSSVLSTNFDCNSSDSSEFLHLYHYKEE